MNMDDALAPASLIDMPAEIVLYIAGHLPTLDVVARFFSTHPIFAMSITQAIKCSHSRISTSDVLRAGLALDAIQHIVEARRQTGQVATSRWLEAAARGGRIEVVEWLCEWSRPEETSGSPTDTFSPADIAPDAAAMRQFVGTVLRGALVRRSAGASNVRPQQKATIAPLTLCSVVSSARRRWPGKTPSRSAD